MERIQNLAAAALIALGLATMIIPAITVALFIGPPQ